MVARLEVERRPLADLAQHLGVLLGLALGRRRIGQVRKRRQQRVDLFLDLGQLLLERLDLRRQLAHRGDLSPTRSSPARFASAICSETRFCSARRSSICGQQLAPPLVEREQLVDLARPPRAARAPP